MKNLFWKTDYRISAPELRVIGADGKLLGILKKDEAVEAAAKLGLTLVEIAPNAKPPVAKIVDFGKFRYQEEKKLRKSSKSKGGDLKEIRFSPFIAENDYLVRLGRVKEFLVDRDKVRLVVVFRRQQLGSKKFGYDLLHKIVDELGDAIAIDMEPKFLGKHLIMGISPTTKGITKKSEPDGKIETKVENLDAKTKE